MASWLHWLGIGEPCHRCGVKVTHRPDLFRIDDVQCCPECFASLKDVEDRRAAEERARERLRYGQAQAARR